jgi:hypothetical protein
LLAETTSLRTFAETSLTINNEEHWGNAGISN